MAGPTSFHRAPLRLALVAVAGAAALAAVAASVVLQHRLVTHSTGLALAPTVLATYAVAFISAGAVGAVLVLRRDGHAVGWASIGLAVGICVAVAGDLYARWGALADPGSLPGAAAVAQVVDASFLCYFVAITVALHLTPTGWPLSPRWGVAMRASVAGGAISFVGALLSDRPIDPPFGAVPDPFAVPGLGAAPELAFQLGAVVAASGLVTGAASLVTRFRRAEGDDRRQLLWLALAVVPMPLFLAATFAFRDANNETPLLVATGTWLVVIPVVIGLSIGRYHLFEVERVVSRTFTYLVLSTLLAATYAAVVVAAGLVLSGGREAAIAATLATLAAAVVAGSSRRAVQDRLDRRFNRRRHDALAVVDRHLQDPAGRQIEDVLREALGDPSLSVAYWLPERRHWVDAAGAVHHLDADHVEVAGDGAPVARIGFDPSVSERSTVDAVATRARVELDNARLRAGAALQLVEVQESRARLAAAQLAERERLERDLHDGAQQRLLALALDLRAAQLNGGRDRLDLAVAAGIDQALAAVEDLRALANGLRPPVLADLGLAAAVDDLARRLPVTVVVDCTPRRFTPELEATAWFVLCEAVTNACKHASPSSIVVEVRDQDRWLHVRVRDDGCGLANPAGRGVRGMRDRAEAAGGALDVVSGPSGTTVAGRFPCPA